MENKEIKRVPDISFSDKRSAKNENTVTRKPRQPEQRTAVNGNDVSKRSASTAVKPKHEKTAVSEVETSENKTDAVNEAAQERISEHKASLDQLFYEMDKEKEQEEKSGNVTESSPAAEDENTEAAPLEFHNDYSAQKNKTPKKKKKKKKKKKVRFNGSIVGGLTLTIVIITMSIVLATGAITLGMEYLGINKSDNEITLNIPEGSTNDEIADILVEKKIIENKKLFKVALKLNNPKALYPGDIKLSPNLGYSNIIEKLATMRESYETVTITIPEGSTLLQVANKLEKNDVCSAEDFLFQFNTKQDTVLDSHVTSNPDAFYSMEGYFFPDTYEFYVEDSAYNIVSIVREHFSSKITDEMYERMDELDMDLNEVITLASIVQWESGSVEDMPKVASVFINRMNDPDTFPTLQSDATKNYVKKVIKKVETSSTMIDRYTNCYDTYTCMGLPAGPVCNPGLDAINAVLYPEDTDYYYFCNNLETGESFFAETYKQHKKNLKKAGLSE